MRTFFALCAALLIAVSFNLKVSAQGGVIIQGGPEVKIKKKVEKKIRQKGDREVHHRVIIRSDKGEQRIVELKDLGVDAAGGDFEVIDLGDGRQAMISIRSAEKSDSKPRALWATSTEGGEGATIEIEIEDHEETEHAHPEHGHHEYRSHRGEHAGGAWKVGPGSHRRLLVLKGHDRDESDEIAISIEGLEPILGHIMRYIDLEEVGPMIGAFLGDMDVEVEVEDGRIEIEAEGLHDIMKQPGLHQLLLQHLDHGQHQGHGKANPHDLLLRWSDKAEHKEHEGRGEHGKADPHDNPLRWSTQAEGDFTISGLAPGVHQVVIAEADCECECDCACCKAGKCAAPKTRTFFQQDGTRLLGRLVEPKAPKAPRAIRRQVATLVDPATPHAPQAVRRHIATFVDPEAPKAGRRAIAIMQGDGEGRRRTATTFGLESEGPTRRYIRLQQPDTEGAVRQNVDRHYRVVDTAPTAPKKGADIDGIEERLERLSTEMKALRKELRALRRKI